MYSVRVADEFKRSTNWYNVFLDFHDYKLWNDKPNYFGRDEKYFHDEIWHIHITTDPVRQQAWSKQPDMYRRTNSLNDPQNDFFLLYGKDEVREQYLMLALIGPDAHHSSEWRADVTDLYVKVVEPWIFGKRKYDEEPDQ